MPRLPWPNTRAAVAALVPDEDAVARWVQVVAAAAQTGSLLALVTAGPRLQIGAIPGC
jgi:hypothetical protein